MELSQKSERTRGSSLCLHSQHSASFGLLSSHPAPVESDAIACGPPSVLVTDVGAVLGLARVGGTLWCFGSARSVFNVLDAH
jgi:hypothetical protein